MIRGLPCTRQAILHNREETSGGGGGVGWVGVSGSRYSRVHASLVVPWIKCHIHVGDE